MNSVSSCGLFWAKQPLALFALLVSQMGKLADTWHQIKITWKNFINFFLFSWWVSSSISGREQRSLETCWKWWALSVCITFIFCLFKDWKFWPWKLIPSSHSWQLTLDEAHVAPGLFREGCELPSWQKKSTKPLFPPEHCSILLFREIRSICTLLSVSASSANPFCSPGAFMGPVVYPGSLGAQLARSRCDRNRDMSGSDHSALLCPGNGWALNLWYDPDILFGHMFF